MIVLLKMTDTQKTNEHRLMAFLCTKVTILFVARMHHIEYFGFFILAHFNPRKEGEYIHPGTMILMTP